MAGFEPAFPIKGLVPKTSGLPLPDTRMCVYGRGDEGVEPVTGIEPAQSSLQEKCSANVSDTGLRVAPSVVVVVPFTK